MAASSSLPKSGKVVGLLPATREYDGWSFEYRGPALQTTVVVYEIKAHDVPDTDQRKGSGVADPFVRVHVANDGLQHVTAETQEQQNQQHPEYDDELRLAVPSGCGPKLMVELWDKDYSQKSLRIASVPIELGAATGSFERESMTMDATAVRQVEGGLDRHPGVSLRYRTESSSVAFSSWSQVRLTSASGSTKDVVWSDDVLRSLDLSQQSRDPDNLTKALESLEQLMLGCEAKLTASFEAVDRLADGLNSLAQKIEGIVAKQPPVSES